MRAGPPILDPDLWSAPVTCDPVVVEQAQIDAYADVTGAVPGPDAPLLFAVVPTLVLLADRASAPVGGVPVGVLHGEHSIRQSRAIRAGDVVSATSAVVAVRSIPAGAAVTTRTTMHTSDGELLNEQWSTNVLATSCDTTWGTPHRSAWSPTDRPPRTTVEVATTTDLALRYATASGDHNPIHVDAAAAADEGHASPILHGLCTMAIAVGAAADAAGLVPTSASLRFTHPVVPGDRLTVQVWDHDPTRFSVRVGDVPVAERGHVSGPFRAR